eukprot:TRINITY_DN2943_c0_g1_i3.p3 TRINITY_DN2943_c0_g1~~TRINITY_DN2943_c0_g1_i3.p3  ORF type:complete len:301 (+),score=171.04 TRINITY_DN2943_c0_g1_i3:1954-2856(+)
MCAGCVCGVGGCAGIALARALEGNRTLHTLRLHDNFLTEQAGTEMAQALGGNTTLTVIDLGGNQLNHFTVNKIKQLCIRNRTMKKSQELAPLKEEIARLRAEQQRLPETALELKQSEEAFESAQKLIRQTEAQVAQLKLDAKQQIGQLKKQFKDVQSQLKEQQAKLHDRDDDMRKMHDDYEAKTRELQATLQIEAQAKEQLEAELDTVQSAIEHDSQQQQLRVDELKTRLSATLEQTGVLRSRERQLQAELERLNAELADLVSNSKKKKVAAFMNNKPADAARNATQPTKPKAAGKKGGK